MAKGAPHCTCPPGKNAEVATVLLYRGAAVNAVSFNGSTPLHYAAMLYSSGITHLLLEARADVNAWTLLGLTPKHSASVLHSYDNPEIGKALLKRGAAVDAVDINGQTPLHHTTRFNNCRTMPLLLDNGPDIRARTTKGEFPIQLVEMNYGDNGVKILNDRAGVYYNVEPRT